MYGLEDVKHFHSPKKPPIIIIKKFSEEFFLESKSTELPSSDMRMTKSEGPSYLAALSTSSIFNRRSKAVS